MASSLSFEWNVFSSILIGEVLVTLSFESERSSVPRTAPSSSKRGRADCQAIATGERLDLARVAE
jgi:hypothetical protein